LPPRRLTECRRLLLRQRKEAPLRLPGSGTPLQRGLLRQETGRAQPGQGAPPEALRGRGILALQPGDVLMKRVRRREAKLPNAGPAVGKAREGAEQLAQKLPPRPAVDQEVMHRPDELVHALRQLEERQPQERRRGEIETARAIRREKSGQPLLLLR